MKAYLKVDKLSKAIKSIVNMWVAKEFGGLKKDDTPILKGYQIFHNYIRPHQGLNGKTPSEACGITLEGKNKWITLIQNASIES